MKTTLATWEDETSNRQVQFSVQYGIENGAVAVKSVTPEKVSFVCPESNTLLRSIAVHTEKGRDVLARRFQESSAYLQLAQVIAAPNGDTSIPQMSIRQEVLAL